MRQYAKYAAVTYSHKTDMPSYASMVYAVIMCPSICLSVYLSVRPSQAAVVSKPLDE